MLRCSIPTSSYNGISYRGKNVNREGDQTDATRKYERRFTLNGYAITLDNNRKEERLTSADDRRLISEWRSENGVRQSAFGE
ncbi:hypothetical protein QTP88_001439 [Uroleucon formosanum]